MKILPWLAIGGLLAAFTITPTMAEIKKAPFGKTKDGTAVDLYTLSNGKGMTATITNYGGIVTSLMVPDKDGKSGDVVLGYDKVEDYVAASPYFGCIAGRYCNRIAKGKFTVDGKEHTLATNNNANHLHGGDVGFDKKVWSATTKETSDGPSLELTYTSKDGEEGYPGNLKCKVTYTVTNDHSLKCVFEATTDKTTPINLTQHSYFNLAGAGSGDILNHELTLHCDKFVPTDAEGIPTGKLAEVKGTPFDFTKSHKIGARIGDSHEQIKFGLGYDHNWCVNDGGEGIKPAAVVYEAGSGRVMEVHTSEPGIQFYTGNYLDGTNVGKGGKAYQHRNGFCLETQKYPDSPNQSSFPSSLLKPGENYKHTCIYKFSVRK